MTFSETNFRHVERIMVVCFKSVSCKIYRNDRPINEISLKCFSKASLSRPSLSPVTPRNKNT